MQAEHEMDEEGKGVEQRARINNGSSASMKLLAGATVTSGTDALVPIRDGVQFT